MRDANQQVLHLTHPRPIQWSLISRFLSKTLKLSLVSYAEWLARLEKSAGEVNVAANGPGEASNPALGLLDYFRAIEVGTNPSKEALGLPKLGVQEGAKVSAALMNAEPLTMADAVQWIASWESAGFLKL
jgi:hypothetical protein